MTFLHINDNDFPRGSQPTSPPTPRPASACSGSVAIYSCPVTGAAATSLPTSLGTGQSLGPRVISSSTEECKPDLVHVSSPALPTQHPPALCSSPATGNWPKARQATGLGCSWAGWAEKLKQHRNTTCCRPCRLARSRMCAYRQACVYTHTHPCLGTQSYLDTCPLGWEPRGPRSSPLCTGRSGRRLCCGCT